MAMLNFKASLPLTINMLIELALYLRISIFMPEFPIKSFDNPGTILLPPKFKERMLTSSPALVGRTQPQTKLQNVLQKMPICQNPHQH